MCVCIYIYIYTDKSAGVRPWKACTNLYRTCFSGNHLSNTTCLTQVFFKSDKSCSKFN